MSRLSVSFCQYLYTFFLLFWESSSFDPNWFQVNSSIFLKGLALIFCLKIKNVRVCFSDHIRKGESLIHFHWVYLLPVTPSDSFWWPEAQCLRCDVVVSVEGERCPSSFFFSGELWSKKPGHTSASPWVAAAELRVLCLWAYVLQGVTSESAGGYCCSLKSSWELSGTCHSTSCKAWRCHWVFVFLLSRQFPESFSAFLLLFPMSLWLQVHGTAGGAGVIALTCSQLWWVRRLQTPPFGNTVLCSME